MKFWAAAETPESRWSISCVSTCKSSVPDKVLLFSFSQKALLVKNLAGLIQMFHSVLSDEVFASPAP